MWFLELQVDVCGWLKVAFPFLCPCGSLLVYNLSCDCHCAVSAKLVHQRVKDPKELPKEYSHVVAVVGCHHASLPVVLFVGRGAGLVLSLQSLPMVAKSHHCVAQELC